MHLLLDSDWWKSSVSRRYIGKSSTSRKETGDSGRDATVHKCCTHNLEEKRGAGGCRGAGAFSSRGKQGREGGREAGGGGGAGLDERRNSKQQRSVCTRGGATPPQ